MTIVPEEVVSTRDRISGWVLKISEVVAGVACRRFGVLEDDTFTTYRQEKDEKTSAVYPLHARCEVSGLDQKEIYIREKGKNSFVAYVAGKYEKIDGYQFSVLWPGHGRRRESKGVKLILGFETETTAARWQTAFLTSIERLAMLVSENEISSPPMPMPTGSPLHPNRDNAHTPSSISQEKHIKGDSARDTDPSKKLDHVSSQTSYFDVADDGIARSSSFASSVKSQMNIDPSSLQSRHLQFWSPWKLVNGLAIYKEDDPSEGVEAFMVSCIVRSAPSVCFKELITPNSDPRGETNGFLNMEIVDNIDDHADVVYSRLGLGGWLGSVLAPREILLDRNWRREEDDGTFVVVMKSSDRFFTERRSREAKQETLGQMLWDPVRAQVRAAVFTIAPLQDKYFNNSTESPEALLTMVIKIDLGGVLSPLNWLSPFSSLLGHRDSWIESILMTVVALKDRVEQSRFVSPPLSGAHPILPESSAALVQEASPFDQGPPTERVENELEAPRAASLESSAAHSGEVAPELRSTGTLDPVYWSSPGPAAYRVRGQNYLVDKKKIMAGEPMFRLMSVDLLKLDRPTPHISQHLHSIKNSTAAFLFVVQIMVPGEPNLGLVMAWGSKDDGHTLENASMSLDDTDSGEVDQASPFDLSLMKFFTGDDETRNATFKLIPHIVKGSFIIKQSVGSTPVLLGKKLKQYYFKSSRYIEVDVDIGSSYTAATVVNMVSGVTKSVIVDMGIVLEGKTPQELPESLLGTVRLDHLDLSKAVYLDVGEEVDQSSKLAD